MTNRLSTYIFIIIVLSTTVLTTAAQDLDHEVNLLKAVFIFNFAKFTLWPKSHTPGPNHKIRLCSVGNDSLADNLDILEGKYLRGKPIEIYHYKSESTAISKCHVLYFARSSKSEIESILKSLASAPVLTVSELPDFVKSGGIIELRREEEKIRFTINHSAAKGVDLKLSARLLDLATVVKEEVKP